MARSADSISPAAARDAESGTILTFLHPVVSGNRTGIVREEELDIGQRLDDVRRRNDAVGKAVRAAMPRMPITVFRPSAMVGQWR